MLEKANLYAQLYIRPNEQNLSRSLFLATGDVLPLNEKGERVWPKAQDDASLCWWTPPVPPRRWRVSRREPQRSIKGNWCGGVWQVDAHLKRLQR